MDDDEERHKTSAIESGVPNKTTIQSTKEDERMDIEVLI